MARRILCLETRELADAYGRGADPATGFYGCASLAREPRVPTWLRHRLDRAIAAMRDVMEPLAIAVEQRREEMLSVAVEGAPPVANEVYDALLAKVLPTDEDIVPPPPGTLCECGHDSEQHDYVGDCRATFVGADGFAECDCIGWRPQCPQIPDPRRAPTDPAPPDTQPEIGAEGRGK